MLYLENNKLFIIYNMLSVNFSSLFFSFCFSIIIVDTYNEDRGTLNYLEI